MVKIFDWHIHLTGSIPIDYWKKVLIQKNKLQAKSISQLKSELYLQNSAVWSDLKICTDTAEGFKKTCIFIIRDMINRGLYGANFIFNPYSLLKRGLDINQAFELIDPFLKNLIETKTFYPLFRIGVNRRDGLDELIAVAKIFKMNHSKYSWLEAIDINGDEKLYPLKPFIKELLNIQKDGIPFTIHSGEGFELISSLEDALSCSPLRIGHGVGILNDNSLTKELKRKGIALEICISSNLETFNVEIENYPIEKLFESGIDILLGSDNPSFINTKIENEYSIVKNLVGATKIEGISKASEKYLRRKYSL